MLWFAYYPCRYLRLSSHLWTRQCPRFFRFPVRFASVGHCERLSTSFSSCALRLREFAFASRPLERLSINSFAQIYSVERLGEFRSTHTPVCGLEH
jgi:hypothetical protein